MKYILTISLFLFYFIVNAQTGNPDTTYSIIKKEVKPENKNLQNGAATARPIVMRCSAAIINSEPLIVVDGVVYEFNKLGELSPAEMISIYVLKDAAASAIYGYRAARGVVIITTNRSDKDFILISNVEDHSPIAGATCFIRSKDNYLDSTIAVSDSAGKIYRKQFPKASGFEITVTSVGYSSQSRLIGKSYWRTMPEIVLWKNYQQCPEVIIMATWESKRSVLRICGGVPFRSDMQSTDSLSNSNSENRVDSKVYPNPVLKGQYFTIEINSSTDQQLTAKIISFSGQLLKQQSVKLNKGNNIFQTVTDSRWASGVYIVQLNDAAGKLVKQDKIAVQ